MLKPTHVCHLCESAGQLVQPKAWSSWSRCEGFEAYLVGYQPKATTQSHQPLPWVRNTDCAIAHEHQTLWALALEPRWAGSVFQITRSWPAQSGWKKKRLWPAKVCGDLCRAFHDKQQKAGLEVHLKEANSQKLDHHNIFGTHITQKSWLGKVHHAICDCLRGKHPFTDHC